MNLNVKPFLRWAGGKSWLMKRLNKGFEFNFNNYHEPFLGGASAFFNIRPSNNIFLSDINEDLINCYICVRDDINGVLRHLFGFENTSHFYYKIRNQVDGDSTFRAARFIYLNQTSFNGIYRVNLNGVYNVPFGNRKKDFLEENLLRNVSTFLQGANLFSGDFSEVRHNIKPNDLVFLDPPYTVTHNNNGFIKYNEKLFSLDDQYRLNDLISFINSHGAYYILSNADHNKVRDIFSSENNCYQFYRPSLIGGAKSFRGDTSELVFTNIPENEFFLNLD